MPIELKVGCDPELFLSLDGKFISAHDILPGTKDKPHKVEKGAVQVDGLAFEFNIDPAKTVDEFNNNIETVLKQMEEMVAKVDKKIKLKFSPIAYFDENYFKSLPRECKILGCDPDFNYMGNVNKPFQDITDVALRTAAGHLHVGWTENEDAMSPAHFEDCKFIANHFYQNNFRSEFSAKTIEERTRLSYYGFNGAFRPKSYGIELRQFSNLWVEKELTRKRMFEYVTGDIQKLYKGN